eukprot:13648811-Alexandrium_andersonii.AAC.1
MDDVLQSLKILKDAGHIRLLVFCWWRKYDETPMHLNVRWRQGSEADDSEAQDERLAKVFTVEHTWAALIATADLADPLAKSLFVRGPLRRSSRVASNMTQEAVVALLDSVCPLPSLAAEFDQVETVVTTDEHASNMASERSILSRDACKLPDKRLALLHL